MSELEELQIELSRHQLDECLAPWCKTCIELQLRIEYLKEHSERRDDE